MSIHQSKIIIDGIQNHNSERLIAWWYCGFVKNHRAPSDPQILVCFKLQGKSQKYYYYKVGLSHILQVPIGSIWLGQRRIGQMPLTTTEFSVNYNDRGYTFCGPWEKTSSKTWLIPSFKYTLPEQSFHPKTRLIRFKADNNSAELLVPCLEFFFKDYGFSHFLKKTIITNSFNQVLDKLIAPDVIKPQPDRWLVTARKRCLDDEYIFLAHLKHDPVTKSRVRKIWAQLENSHKNGVKVHNPNIHPWFSGEARIKVSGVWLDKDQKVFLGLRILSNCFPDGKEILFDRENTNLTNKDNTNGKGRSWPKKKSTGTPRDVRITSDEEPGSDEDFIEIYNPPLEILGPARQLTKVVRNHTSEKTECTFIHQGQCDKYSGGTPHGYNESVGQAVFTTPAHLETSGILQDMWKALSFFNQDPSSHITNIASMTWNGPQHSTRFPVMLPFPLLNNPQQHSRSIREWPHLDYTSNKRRNLLIIQIETTAGIAYILEIQRRTKINKEGKKEDRESFAGLVFTAGSKSELYEWLKPFLQRLITEEGKLSRFEEEEFLNGGKPFKHVYSSNGSLKKAVKNALFKVNLPT